VEQGFVSITVIFAALAGAILWNYATWWLGMPPLLLPGPDRRPGWGRAGASAVLIWAIKLVFRRTEEERTERGFRIGRLASSAAVSLGHGTNDAQKTMGVIAALLAPSRAAGRSSAPWASASPSCGRRGGSRPRRPRPPSPS
jgi:inorganic phosphate transporter, PiT family